MRTLISFIVLSQIVACQPKQAAADAAAATSAVAGSQVLTTDTAGGEVVSVPQPTPVVTAPTAGVVVVP